MVRILGYLGDDLRGLGGIPRGTTVQSGGNASGVDTTSSAKAMSETTQRTEVAYKDAKVEVAPTSSGVSAGEIMGGIGAILTPLVSAGVGIYAAQQQANLAKDQVHQAPEINYMPPMMAPPPQKSPVLIIVIGLVGLMVVGGMMFMMMSKGGGGAAPAYGGPPPGYGGPPPGYGPPSPPAVPFAYQPAQPAAPPQMRRRVRRRKRRPK